MAVWRALPSIQTGVRNHLRLLSQSQALAGAGDKPAGRKVPLALIKEVRARSGAPLASVRDALEAAECDVDGALEHLRRSGARLAASRAARPAGEGLIGVLTSPAADRAALVELRCETDFVARTAVFHDALAVLSRTALEGTASGADWAADPSRIAEVGDNAAVLSNAAAVLGENVRVGRVSVVSGPCVGTYVHGRVAPPSDARDQELDAGRIGVTVALDGAVDGADSKRIVSRMSMHVAAEAPLYNTREAIPADVLQRETDILMEAARGEPVKPGSKSRPDDILRKVVDGRLRKWVAEVTLEEQMMLGSESEETSGKPVSVRKWMEKNCRGVRVSEFSRLSIS